MKILDRIFGGGEVHQSRGHNGVGQAQRQPQDGFNASQLDPSQLCLFQANGRPARFPTDGSVFKIGRAPDSSVYMDQNCVSRNHAVGCYKDGQFYVMDVGSSNGTFLNGTRLKTNEWVPVPPDGALMLGGKEGWLKLGQAPPEAPRTISSTPRPPAEPLDLARARLTTPNGRFRAIPKEGGQVFKVGRANDCNFRFGEEENGISRHHAEMKLEGGQLWVKDTHSSNGTYIDGERLPPDRWTPLPVGSQVRFGRSESASLRLDQTSTKPKQAMQMPDGRTALVENLPDGNLKVSKVDVTFGREELDDKKIHVMGDRRRYTEGPDGLKPGVQVLLTYHGRPHIKEFLGIDGEGRYRFGHTDDYSPQEFSQYLQAQKDHVEAEARGRVERAQRREQGTQDLRAQEMQRLGITPELLRDNPVEVAGRLFNGQGKLAHDGTDLWPAEVTTQVENWKRRQFEAEPVQGVDGRPSTLKDAGLTEVRLQQWLAEQRGEFLLFRGIQGAWDSTGEARFWTNELGCAVSYAQGGNKEPNVLMLRIPRSDIPRLYRSVGSLPGRNPYAEVYDIDVRADLDAAHQPMLGFSGRNPQHGLVFNAYKANQDIQDPDAGLTDFRRLDRAIRGDYSF